MSKIPEANLVRAEKLSEDKIVRADWNQLGQESARLSNLDWAIRSQGFGEES